MTFANLTEDGSAIIIKGKRQCHSQGNSFPIRKKSRPAFKVLRGFEAIGVKTENR